MAKVKRNSGFYAQAGLIGNALATAKKPASTTDAVHQAIAFGKKNRKEKTEKVRYSYNFLINGK
jgi:tRNA/tmRNA/rRNA uracil-C5-methylase (TrmA/RlmC/RlmD family)